MNVYVVVSLSGDKQRAKTEVDRKGGTSPSWNFPMKFTIDESAARQNRLNLEFKLRCESSLWGDKDIGVVYVPVAELLVYTGDGKSMQVVSYQVTGPSGKPQGILNFSCKFMEKVATGGELLMPEAKAHEPVIAYAAAMVGTSALPYDGFYPPAAGPHPPYCYGYPLPPAGSGYPPLVPEAKAHEPVTAYPAPVVGTSARPYDGSYPPASAPLPPPPPYGYGYPPRPSGYGYPPLPPGYGYQPAVQQPQKMNKFGMELVAGLLGRVLGGLLIGDMTVPDAGCDAGFGDFV